VRCETDCVKTLTEMIARTERCRPACRLPHQSTFGHCWTSADFRNGSHSGRFASEPEAVALDCAHRFESPPNSRPSMVCSCRASCFCRLLSSCRCCRSSRRLRRLISGRRNAGTATASCLATISHRITPFQLTPRKLRFCGWRVTTGALGISIQSQVITGTMATGTISAGPVFTAVATMAVASALAGRGRRSGRSGIAAD
jgi:hypothetical protein